MGIRIATACLCCVAVVLACGRRGDPIRPDGRQKDTPISLTQVMRTVDGGSFAASTTESELIVDLIPVSEFLCGQLDPRPAHQTRAAVSTNATFTFPVDSTAAWYLRARSNERSSNWFYIPPVSTVPEAADMTIRYFSGHVTVSGTGEVPFRLQEKVGGNWLNRGQHVSHVTLGPYPPDTTVELLAHPVTTHLHGLSQGPPAYLAIPIR